MKRTVREGTFETNSSSQHSLVIKKVDGYFTSNEIKEDFYINDGKIQLYDFYMEFGRSPFKCLSSFRDKWEYSVAALCGKYGDKMWNELEAILKEVIPEIKIVEPYFSYYPTQMSDKEVEDLLEEYEDKLREHGIERELYYDEHDNGWRHYDCPSTGYAEDYGMLSQFLTENNIPLKEFLLNKKYIIICDGDEYCIWGDLKESGLVNKNEIDYEYPRAYGEE